MEENEDVQEQKELVKQGFMDIDQFLIKVKNLGKVYPDGVAAVVGNSF